MIKINREDVVKKCLYNIKTVEDEIELAAANVSMDQSGKYAEKTPGKSSIITSHMHLINITNNLVNVERHSFCICYVNRMPFYVMSKKVSSNLLTCLV